MAFQDLVTAAQVSKLKICAKCKIEKEDNNFSKNKLNRLVSYCKECNKQYQKEHYKINMKRYKQYNTSYYEDNIDQIKQCVKQYSENNVEKINKYHRERHNSNPKYKLRKNVSNSILRTLKANNSSKVGKSCLKFLDYTIEELKNHIESQFEHG